MDVNRRHNGDARAQGFGAVVAPRFQQVAVGGKEGVGRAGIQPGADLDGAHFQPLLQHDVDGVGKVVFAFGLDVVGDLFVDRGGQVAPLGEVVTSHHRQVIAVVVGLFDQALHIAVFVGHHHAEAARVVDRLDPGDGFVGRVAQEAEVGFHDGVDEDHQHGAFQMVAGQSQRVRLPFALFLLYEMGFQVGVVFGQVGGDLFAEVAYDENEFQFFGRQVGEHV